MSKNIKVEISLLQLQGSIMSIFDVAKSSKLQVCSSCLETFLILSSRTHVFLYLEVLHTALEWFAHDTRCSVVVVANASRSHVTSRLSPCETAGIL